MNIDTQQINKLAALLDRIQRNAAALNSARQAGATGQAGAPHAVAAAPRAAGASSPPIVVAEPAVPVPGELEPPELIPLDEPVEPAFEPSIRPSAPSFAEAEPTSTERRAALNPAVPPPPGMPSLPSMRAAPSERIHADAGELPSTEPSMQPAAAQALEQLEPEDVFGEELITIPPSAPPPASDIEASPLTQPPDTAPSEPPALAPQADFVAAKATPSEVEADFSLSAPPPLEEIEAPPISTEQQREEVEGLEQSLGFAPAGHAQPAALDSEEDENVGHTAPRTPPPESGPQVSLVPKEPEANALQVQSPSTELHAVVTSGPTMEQVGSTIDFDASDRASGELELADRSDGRSSVAQDEYEAELPRVGYAGAYDAELSAPQTARDELREHDRLERDKEERRSSAPGLARVETEAAAPSSQLTGASETVSRPTVNVAAPAALFDSLRKPGASGSFLDRLEASLALIPPNE